jgi:hypothetical protein
LEFKWRKRATQNIVNQLNSNYFNQKGGSVKNFVSEYWTMKTYNGYYGTSSGIVSTMGNFDTPTDEAYNYILKNYKKGGRVIIYGYSYGGVLALYLEKRLKANKIKVNFLITIDAAAGPENGKVKRKVSDNTDENLNIYQTTPSSVGSHGDKNEREDGTENGIKNEIDVTYVDEKGNKQKMTHSVIGEQTIQEVVDAILAQLKKNEKK